jgi:hypothetical protein
VVALINSFALTGRLAEAVADDALLVAEGRIVVEALVQAPLLAPVAGAAAAEDEGDGGVVAATVDLDGGIVLVLAPCAARRVTLQVVHVLVVDRGRRRGEEDRQPSKRFGARHSRSSEESYPMRSKHDG